RDLPPGECDAATIERAAWCPGTVPSVTNMNASLLLPSLAKELWHQAQQYVPEVLAHGPSAAPLPLGYFIAAQDQPSASEFQLPEPLLGPVAPSELRILVVGLNPGFGPTEDIPT